MIFLNGNTELIWSVSSIRPCQFEQPGVPGILFGTLNRKDVDDVAAPAVHETGPHLWLLQVVEQRPVPSQGCVPASPHPYPPPPQEEPSHPGMLPSFFGPQGGCWVTGPRHSLAGESFKAGSRGAGLPVALMNMHGVRTQQSSSSN